MTLDRYVIKKASREDVQTAVDWAAEEGWNPGLSDTDAYRCADPDGFFMGRLDGEPVAVISAVRYGRTFGFIGFYIVKPTYRNHGYGLRIWRAALDHLKGRNIGLDGVIAQQENYKKFGFKLSYRNIRYEGETGGASPDDPRLTTLLAVPFETVASFDRAFFPEDRSEFVKSWIAQPGSISLGIVKGETLEGYGVIRPCRNGNKIGPLFAVNPEAAEVLFLALKSAAKTNQPVYLDVPEPNRAAVSMAEHYKMKPTFETARMYFGEAPNTPIDRIFGVTSFEIG